ncbi:aldehyde dehydrogenase family protein [Amycolatopsis sp. NPDC048633]|uniref:aldehyde dehydrogenase family protein n=1 Tax=Amycolatopsis sp. NPDC048633 TaxID=3157095 RepID=UPI0033C4187D
MLQEVLESARSDGPMAAPAFIEGQWSRDGTLTERTGPHLRKVVTRFASATDDQVARAVEYAARSAKTVADLAPASRATILERAAELAAAHRDDIARMIALELGKPLKDGRGELDRVADTFAVCAGETRHIGGDVLPVAGWARGTGNTAMTYRAPAGVALAITPFNAPANLLAHKLGASFAAGNTTLVKAPPQAPATTTAIVALLLEAGMPPEAVQLLHGGGDVGAKLCAADEVAVISFTGSAETGAAVARAAGAKRLVLELGGNAATLVCEDADVAHAAKICARTGYSNSGQSCISVQRIYVHRSRFDEFVDVLRAEVATLKVGDPLDPATDVGSMVDEDAATRVEKWTAEAAAQGARVVLGGTRDGATLHPTIVADPAADATIVVQEVFGALVAVLPFDDLGEAIEACNRSRFGLQAGLFTHDVRTIINAWRDLQVGGLVVNGSSNYRLDHVPFGGVKDSGFGRESPAHMIDDYTVVKTLILRGMSVWGDR